MSKNKLLIDLEVRDKSASNEIRKLNNELKQAQKIQEMNIETARLSGNSYTYLKTRLDACSSSAENVGKQIKLYNDKIKDNETVNKRATENLKNIKVALADFHKEFKNKGALRENQEALSNLRKERLRLLESHKQEKSSLMELESTRKRLVSSIKENKERLKDLVSEGKRESAEYKLLKAEIKNQEDYRRGLNSVIGEQKSKVKELGEALKDNSKTNKEALSSIKSRVDAEKGYNDSIKSTESAIKKTTENIEKYKVEIEKLNATQDNFSAKQKVINEDLEKQQFEEATRSVKAYQEQLQNASDKARTVGDGFNAVGNALFKLSAPMVAFGTYGVKAFVDFEDAFAGVRKTVDATESKFQELQKTIIAMSERMPQSASDIAKVMEMAGQLGVQANDLEKFTEVMLKLGDSTNLASDEAAKLLAQFTNVTGMDTKDIERLGSVVVELGNNSATTEADIVNMMQALSGAGKVFGLTEHQIAGVSATLSELGINSEKGGTAMTTFLMKMAGAGGKATEEFRELAEESGMTEKEIEKAMENSSQALENFANITGMTANEFKKLASENPSEAIYTVVKSLDSMKKEGKDVLPVLELLGFKEKRLRDVVMKLAGGHEKLRKNINLSSKAWAENTALETEAQKRYETTASKLKMLKNQFTNVAMEIGVELLPTLLGLMERAKDFISWIRNMDSGTKRMLITFTKITLALAGLSKGLGGLFRMSSNLYRFLSVLQGFKSVDAIAKSGQALASGINEIGAASVGGASGVGMLKGALGLLNPAVLGVTVGIGALGVAFAGMNTHTKLMNENILYSKEKMTTWEKIVSFVTGTTRKSNAELERMGYKFSELNELTPEFASAVKRARDETANFNIALREMNIDGVFTLDESNLIDKQVESMIQNTIAIIEANKSEIQNKYKEAFNRDGAFTEAEKQTLEYLAKDKDLQIEETKKLFKEIQEIKKKAVEENERELTKKEMEEINKKYAKIKEIELNNLANSEKDRLYMKNEFMNEMSRLDLEGASKLIQERKKLADDEIVSIKTKYDTDIEMLKKQGESLSGEQKLQNEEAIRVLEENKAKELEIARGKYDDILKILKEKFPEIAKEIDESTGNILKDVEKKNAKELESYKRKYHIFDGITKTGWQGIRNNVTGEIDRVYVKVDETTGKIVGVYNQSTNEIISSNDEHKKSLEDLKKTTEFTSHSNARDFLNMVSNMKEGSKLSVWQLNKLEKKFGFVRDASGELKGKIVDLNGTPVEVSVNKEGAIFNINGIINRLSQIRDKEVTVSVYENRYVSTNNFGAGLTNMSGTSYLKSYASGTPYIQPYARGGYVRTRVNENGFELFDLPKNTVGFMRGTLRGEDIMDLPVGTKITNHIASTRLMFEAVKREVKKQVSPVYGAVYGALNGSGEKTIKQEVTVRFENVVINDQRDVKEIMEQMKEELAKEVY